VCLNGGVAQFERIMQGKNKELVVMEMTVVVVVDAESAHGF